MKNLKLKKSAIILLIVCLFLFSGCMPSDTEIKNRFVIEGIGIDYNDGTGEYELTVQVLEESEGAQGQGEAKTPVSNYFVKGKTIAGAVESLCSNIGKKPMYSQNRLIVTGESLQGRLFSDSLNFFVREYTSRPDVTVVSADGRAADILCVKTGSEIPAKVIEDAVTRSNDNSVCVDTSLFNIINLLTEKNTAVVMPLLSVSETVSKEKTVEVNGSRVIKADGSAKCFSPRETTAFLFLSDKINTGAFSVVTEDFRAGLEIVSSKTKTALEIKDGKILIDIDIDCRTDVVEFENGSFDAFDKTETVRIEEAAKDYLCAAVRELAERCYKEDRLDVLRIHRLLSLEYPDMLSEGNELFLLFEFDINADVSIMRVGQMAME